MAVNTPCQPEGLKPWLVKFSPWNAANRNAPITSRMIEQLPPDQHVVDPGEPPDPVVVDDHEHGHQHHRGRVAERGQRVDLLAVHGVLGGERGVLGGVLEGGLDLDGRGRRDRDPGDPARGVARERAEGQVGVAHHATGQREHRAELGVDERDHQDHHAAEGPRHDGRGAGRDGGVQGSEEPSGSDDRSDAGEQQPHDAHMSLQLLALVRGGLCGVRGHAHHLSHKGRARCGRLRPNTRPYPRDSGAKPRLPAEAWTTGPAGGPAASSQWSSGTRARHATRTRLGP